MRFRAASPEVLRIEPLDEVLTAVFHRSSGITHLLTEPAPEILALLSETGLTEGELLARLSGQFDLADDEAGALAARLAELVAAGLVEASLTGPGRP